MQFYIWSIEHNAWWKPNGYGYTTDINQAGIYNQEEAYKIIHAANICCTNNPKETLVPYIKPDRFEKLISDSDEITPSGISDTY
jgi:hypothetical protein